VPKNRAKLFLSQLGQISTNCENFRDKDGKDGKDGKQASTLISICSLLCHYSPTRTLLHRGIRSGLCSPETPTITELAESIDDTLFQRIMHNPYHVMYHLLPPRRELSYNIRQRHHDRQLNIISGQLRSRNFIYRMLLKTVIDCFYIFRVLHVLVQMRSVISV